ncbi:MAG: phosphoribosyl-ATP diphosphatase [Pseudomonadota bacterium]
MTPDDILNELYAVLQERKTAPVDKSYVASLYAGGMRKIAKKLGEEATEVVIAGLNGDETEIINEMSDLWFHSLVLMAAQDIPPEKVLVELSRRFGRSGIEEKASRGT